MVQYFHKYVMLCFLCAVGVGDVGDMDSGQGGHYETPCDWSREQTYFLRRKRIQRAIHTV